jgi:outer membrane protein
MRQELLMETQQLNQKLQEDVKELLSQLRTENSYDYVLSYGSGSGVLMVNEALDITQKLVDLLNAKRPPGSK